MAPVFHPFQYLSPLLGADEASRGLWLLALAGFHPEGGADVGHGGSGFAQSERLMIDGGAEGPDQKGELV